ncbi:MAG: biotin/lipoate A/B protein ligase family protein [Candidatus Woesearchaeota archaeon]
MEDLDLERIIHDDTVPRSPREHLARNLRAAQLVFEGVHESIVRIYRHTPGVILGLNQSLEDVDRRACEELGYELVRRPSGGSAVVVDPDQALCYSVFFLSHTVRPKPFPLYESFVRPFVSELGDRFSVDGYFYVYAPDSEHPVAGHAMAHHHRNAVTQIDGIIHLSDPDVERFSRVLRMRELYTRSGTPIIRSNGAYYSKTGKLLTNADRSSLTWSRCERSEISRSIGMRRLGIPESAIVQAIARASERRFGEVTRVGSFDYGDVDEYRIRVDEDLVPKKWNAQGHCFVDF